MGKQAGCGEECMCVWAVLVYPALRQQQHICAAGRALASDTRPTSIPFPLSLSPVDTHTHTHTPSSLHKHTHTHTHRRLRLQVQQVLTQLLAPRHPLSCRRTSVYPGHTAAQHHQQHQCCHCCRCVLFGVFVCDGVCGMFAWWSVWHGGAVSASQKQAH